MTAEAVPFAPGHLRRLAPGAQETELLRGVHPGCLAGLALPGPAVTLVEGGRVLGCAGILPEGGDGVVWSILSDALRRRPATLHRAAKRFLAVHAPRFRRLRGFVRADFHAGRRWLGALGFCHRRDHADFLGTGEIFSELEMTVALPYLAIASSIAAGVQATAAARAQARQANHQADILRRQAEQEARLLDARGAQQRQQHSRALGAQRAVLAARGLDLTAGSALLVQEQAAADAEFEALLARASGEMGLFDTRARAGTAGLKAGAARQNAAFTAGTSLLTAGSTVSKEWDKL